MMTRDEQIDALAKRMRDAREKFWENHWPFDSTRVLATIAIELAEATREAAAGVCLCRSDRARALALGHEDGSEDAQAYETEADEALLCAVDIRHMPLPITDERSGEDTP